MISIVSDHECANLDQNNVPMAGCLYILSMATTAVSKDGRWTLLLCKLTAEGALVQNNKHMSAILRMEL